MGVERIGIENPESEKVMRKRFSMQERFTNKAVGEHFSFHFVL